MTDIDIDIFDRAAALNGLRHVPAATRERSGKRWKHNSGVYFQDIPVDPLDGLAAWDHEAAEEHGFFKIDLLSKPFYGRIRDEEHLVTLLITEAPWDKFSDPDVLCKLEQRLENHYEIMQKVEPRSISELAVCLALVRPGKRYLLRRPRFEIFRDVWLPTPTGEYTFRRAHGIAYAAMLVVQLNLLVEEGEICK